MKCLHCGSSLKLSWVKLKDGVVCAGCYKKLGFDPIRDIGISQLRTYEDLKHGPGYRQPEDIKKDPGTTPKTQAGNSYEFLVHWDDEATTEYLERYQRSWTDSEDLHEGYTFSSLREAELYDEKIPKYPALELTAELRPTDDDVEVWIYDGKADRLVGYPAKTKKKKLLQLLSEHPNCDVEAELSGGPFWRLNENNYVEDDWSDPLKVKVTIKWQ